MTKVKAQNANLTDPQYGVYKKNSGDNSQIYPKEVNQFVYDVDNKVDLAYHVGISDYLRTDTSATGWTISAGDTSETTLLDTTNSGNRWNPLWVCAVLIELNEADMTKTEIENANNLTIRARINGAGTNFFSDCRCEMFAYKQQFQWFFFGPYEISDRESDTATTIRFSAWNGNNSFQVKIARISVYYWF